MKTPYEVSELSYHCNCTNISIRMWDKLMTNATKANKRKINRLVKKHLPDLYEDLALHLDTRYNYYKTRSHLILVHSAIEHFLLYKL